MPAMWNDSIGTYTWVSESSPAWKLYKANKMAKVSPPLKFGTVKTKGIKSNSSSETKPSDDLGLPLKPMEGFTFGADPELFVADPDGNIVCADMIPGTKDEPHRVKHGAIQRDGFAAEYNIDVCRTFEEWNRNHKAVQGQLQSFLPKGFKLVAQTSVRFSPEVFDAAPDCAKELGCSPDWNAWTGQLNPPPKLPDDPYLRCIGGHIHVGWGENLDPTDIQHRMNCFDLVKQLEFFLAAWSLRHDADTERRKLYGRAGACRIKSYGVEYRVLSSFWVLNKTTRLQVWNRLVQAINAMNKYPMVDHIPGGYDLILQERINEGRRFKELERSYPFPIENLHFPAMGL